MRTVGQRIQRSISYSASSALLEEGVRFNDEMHKLPSGSSSFIPKGVYFFARHEDANRHQEECLARGMAQIVQARRRTTDGTI